MSGLTMFAVVLVLLVVVCSGNGGQWQTRMGKVKMSDKF